MAPNNALPIWGNAQTMNMNPLILTNIQSSPYFKVNLYELKTYHEVIDEIYYKVSHLEPWEKGSRKTAGQIGMCGGVRGVGAGGIVSSAYCLLYKLYTLKLTRKQVNGLITHQDSPYIRGLGFMYIRYTQPPQDLWEWYEEYLDDDEEIDVKAGGGHSITIGEMLRQWLVKLEWYATLFPRIPVPVQKSLEQHLRANPPKHIPGPGSARNSPQVENRSHPVGDDGEVSFGEAARMSSMRRSPVAERHGRGYQGGRKSPPFDIAKEIEKEKERQKRRSRSRSRSRRSRSREKRRSHSRERRRHRSRSKERRDRDKHREKDRHRERDHRGHRSRSRDRDRKSSHQKERSRHRSRSQDKSRHRSRSRERNRHDSYERDLRREKDRVRT